MLDPWLSEILGYPVYNSSKPPENDERSLTWVKVPVHDVATVHELTERGFRVVDVNVQSSRYGDPGLSEFDFDDVVVADPSHHQALLEIAGCCFVVSRFHLDPLTIMDAGLIKCEWLRNCLEGRRGLEVLVALDGEQPIGFLAIRQIEDARYGRTNIVDLIGVNPNYQGRYVGTKLLSTAICRAGDRTLVAGTSLANMPAMRLYSRCGLGSESASYVLHLHRGVQ